MPGRIVVAFVAELRLQGFWVAETLFPELLRILEKWCRAELSLGEFCNMKVPLPNSGGFWRKSDAAILGRQTNALRQIPVGCGCRIDAVGDRIPEGVIGLAQWRRGFLSGRLLFGQSGLVALEPAFEHGDGRAKVVAEDHEEVDVVEVGLAAEAVGEVVAWVDCPGPDCGRICSQIKPV